MTASSYYAGFYKPGYGRLNINAGDGWCTRNRDRNDEWLQVDLGKTNLLCAVATQGDRNGKEWVTAFKLAFSSDGSNWEIYKDSDGKAVVRFDSLNSKTL